MQTTVYILFDDIYAYLGELFTEEGKFSHLTMTPYGEQVLGEKFEEWQLRGVPALQDIITEKHTSTSYTHDGRVLLRDHGSVDALRAWLEAHTYRVLPMTVEALDCWEMVLQLPLEPDERHALASDLSLVPQEELGAWKRTLQDAAKAADLVIL